MTKISVKVPEILLPDASVDMSKWAVVACDQYTSEPDYWEGVKKATDSSPSTLNIISRKFICLKTTNLLSSPSTKRCTNILTTAFLKV